MVAKAMDAMGLGEGNGGEDGRGAAKKEWVSGSCNLVREPMPAMRILGGKY